MKKRLLSTGFGDYDAELSLSKEPIKIKKIKMVKEKERRNTRVFSTGIGKYDLELNFGKDPLRIRNTEKETFN